MGESQREEKNLGIKLDPALLNLLRNFKEIELEDVELDIGDLEITLEPSMPLSIATPIPSIPSKVKPTSLLQSDFKILKGDYLGQIVEVKLGATKGEGGSRGSSLVVGGETAPPYYLFDSPVIHPPVIAFDVFDKAPPLAKVMKAPFNEVLDDPAAWAKRCVSDYGADMVQLHLTSIDPLWMDTPPKEAAKTVENVLQAVDVPLAVGGCGDPQKDLKVFEKVAEVGEGERLLINSVTLDMDIQKTAELVKNHGHAVIAFTSMDMAMARELNRRLYDLLPREDIITDTTTAALGYGLDYAFTIMERTRLAGLMGDQELQHPLASGTTNAWAAREAWMKMDPQWGPRELRGPIWETVTALTLLLAGVDWFMMFHPAAVKTIKTIIQNLTSGTKASSEQLASWVTLTI
ncbi:MAG: CO dehydrogenase/acetyl-CoA synthase subunit delta [Candidatus Bathyarchaeota archaeon]|nr:MAG: CO dehydrogenase/acetyl-CoA synthase subunit delta [Candidatus Bathyarchaeota archaeon]